MSPTFCTRSPYNKLCDSPMLFLRVELNETTSVTLWQLKMGGNATYIIINSVSYSATWLNLLNCLGDGHICLPAPMDTGKVRRTYKIMVKLVRHRRLQLCNFVNSLTLSKLKEMPCYIGDLDTALRLGHHLLRITTCLFPAFAHIILMPWVREHDSQQWT